MYNLQTSTNPNRDVGSGTWQIKLVNGDGGPIRYGDKIYLLNQYGKRSYLDTCGSSTCEPSSNGVYNLQTSISPNRDVGSGTWEIISANGYDGPVSIGDKIHLLNQYGTQSYLDTCGSSTCPSSNGVYNLQTSTNPNRETGSGTWEIGIVYQGK